MYEIYKQEVIQVMKKIAVVVDDEKLINVEVACIEKVAMDEELNLEKITDNLYVARDREEDGQKYEAWT